MGGLGVLMRSNGKVSLSTGLTFPFPFFLKFLMGVWVKCLGIISRVQTGTFLFAILHILVHLLGLWLPVGSKGHWVGVMMQGVILCLDSAYMQ